MAQTVPKAAAKAKAKARAKPLPLAAPIVATAAEMAMARQARRAGLAIAGTMLGWILLQLIGAQYDWPPKYALLVDLFALVGFIWALAVVFQIWRARRSKDRP